MCIFNPGLCFSFFKERFVNSTLFGAPAPQFVWSMIEKHILLELQLPSSPWDFKKNKIKESICFPTLDRQIRVQTRGVGGAGALSAGAAPRNPGHIWDSTSVPATHPPALFDSPSTPVPWFEYSVEKMSVFGNKQTCKQTTQAIVIVLLSDASLRRLWKRASPESFKTWYQT